MADSHVDILRSFFFNRTDVAAFGRKWGALGKPYPTVIDGNLDELLDAHVHGEDAPPAVVRFDTSSGWKTAKGRFRIGSYAPASDGTTRWLCIDLDGDGHAHALADPLAATLATVAAFEGVGLRAHLERSGGGAGFHVWCFFATPVSAADARRLGFGLIPKEVPLASGGLADPRQNQGIEVFPKQSKLAANKFGNLVWLPFWYGAKNGGNEFYRVLESGALEPIEPAIAQVSTADVSAALAALPASSTVPVTRPTREARRPSGLASFDDAVRRFNADHRREFSAECSPCPVCGSPDGFKASSTGQSRWACFSTDHAQFSDVGIRGTGCWHGDVLNLDAHAAGLSRRDLLVRDGYLISKGTPVEPEHVRRAPPPDELAGSSTEPPTPPHPADDPGVVPPDDLAPNYLHLTDVGNAERVVVKFGPDLRFIAPQEAWLEWDGQRWARDYTGGIVRKAILTARAINEDVKLVRPAKKDDAEDEVRHDKEVAAIESWAHQSESQARLNAMIGLAQSQSGIATLPSVFDTDPDVLNLLNGTLDLRTGRLRPHRRADLITKLVPIVYTPDATCPRWVQFIEEIFLGDLELIDFVQRALGYTLTGSDREQVFFICHGTGQNGKGRLFEVMLRVLGAPADARPAAEGYAVTAHVDTFSARRETGGDKPRPDLVRLRGVRLVTASEQDQAVRLDEALIKQMTGGDPLTVRDTYERPITFRPVFKLWLAVNHRPRLAETGHGMWRRVRLIPFDYQVPEDKRDPDLDEKLRAELPGILNWMLKGMAEWRKAGLGSAERSVEATRAYRAEVDIIGRFIEDECVLLPEAETPAGAMYQAYCSWCERNGEKPLNQTTFGRKLTDRGLVAGQNAARTRRVRKGVGLRSERSPDGLNPSVPQPVRPNPSVDSSIDYLDEIPVDRTGRTGSPQHFKNVNEEGIGTYEGEDAPRNKNFATNPSDPSGEGVFEV